VKKGGTVTKQSTTHSSGDTTAPDGLNELIVTAVTEACDPFTDTTVADAILRIPAAELSAFMHARFDADGDYTILTTGLPASPGAASGRIVTSAEAAVDAADRGLDVILVRTETTPDDVLGMQSARGILTARGGLVSHAAVVARGWGIPAVVGAGDVVVVDGGIRIGDTFHAEGTEISIDGRTGNVIEGAVVASTRSAPPELDTLLRWADLIRAGRVGVRANADTADDAAHARHLGAEGIGLCRTEHMFLAEHRLRLVRRLILSDDPTQEREILHELDVVQQSDFASIIDAMDGLPVTVRLLDPPLHEFLPDYERLVVAEATGTLDDESRAELVAVRRLREANPMIGTRGVRLGVVKPGVYQMQVRALARAVGDALAAGRDPNVEIMIPLVMGADELAMARGWVMEALDDAGVSDFDAVSIGAMVETPRAALVAADLSAHADFFSFGTNDLTQLTFAFSRDDVEVRLLPAYLAAGVLPFNPFEQLDREGVGRLIEMTCTDARAAKPEIKIGICGEQAGDPASARFLVDAGVDYVSCSPYRVPIARLAVAQALLDAGRVPDAEIERLTADVGGDHAAPRAPESSAATTTTQIDDDEARFLVLHALRIKGFSNAATVAELSTVDSERTASILNELAESGHTKYFEARDLWQLTPDGKERHAAEIVDAAAELGSGLRSHYEPFLELNTRLKELCTAWQTRGGEPNDHTDAAYDAERLAELDRLNQACAPVLDGFAAVVPRFAAYRHRLTGAAARAVNGETKMFTGVMCGSFHDIWMELHEDLIQLLSIDRHAEGSY
jgi:phosphoenolpyruvate-protein kinase (PTS system EI component)